MVYTGHLKCPACGLGGSNPSTPTKKIAVFYHVYQYGNWLALVNEQIEAFKKSGLYDASSLIHIGINGSEPFPFEDDKFHIVYNEVPHLEETATLESLRQFCEQNDNWDVLYFHTKGVTQQTPETTDWRKVMEYFCIERWQDCVEQLKHHDTVGCLYIEECHVGFYPHYSGNFWWSKSEYITTLNHNYLSDGDRTNREFWIGTGNGSMFSFMNTSFNHYLVRFPREMYASKRQELVVAHYNEDISWLSEVNSNIDIYLYEKDKVSELLSELNITNQELLPNIGNEAHTYIYHIVKTYNDPADLVFFVQGRPFDHSPDALKYINGESTIESDYLTLCSWVTTCDSKGFPHAPNLPVDEYYLDIFGEPTVDSFTFGAGAQFCVTRRAILSKPIEFWEKLLILSEKTPEAAYVFERLWHKFFEVS